MARARPNDPSAAGIGTVDGSLGVALPSSAQGLLPDEFASMELGAGGSGGRPSRANRIRAILRAADLWIPATMVILMILACFVWPEIYPLRNPTKGVLANANLPPFSRGYLLGADTLGDDVLSRILYGGRTSLEVGFASNALGLIIGGTLGTVAGYLGGIVESVVMRIIDMFLAFPALVLALVIVTYLGASELHLIWAIAFFGVPAYARLARAQSLRTRELNFILAARLSGTPHLRIVRRHIARNVLPGLLTFACLGIAIAIFVESALSFLGLGVPAPAPSWGNMIALGQTYLASNPYLIIVPSAFLFVTVLSLNLLGDALRARWAER